MMHFRFGTKLGASVTYACRWEGRARRKVLIRNNGSLRYVHRAQGGVWAYLLTHLPGDADLYFEETGVTSESRKTHLEKGSKRNKT